MNKNYDDIINLPHYVSKKRPQMSIESRSAQFTPFAALTGYDEQVRETARLTNRKIEVADEIREEINYKLNIIYKNIKNEPIVSITYFIPDKKKDGGEYVTKVDKVRRIDKVNDLIIMFDKTKINMNNVLNITGEIFEILEKENNE